MVLSLSSLKKNGVGWGGVDPSFLVPLRGGWGLVKSYGKDIQYHSQRMIILKNNVMIQLHTGNVRILLLPLSSYFYLSGNLAKVADISQDCALDEGVLSILPTSLGIEVWMERV